MAARATVVGAGINHDEPLPVRGRSLGSVLRWMPVGTSVLVMLPQGAKQAHAVARAATKPTQASIRVVVRPWRKSGPGVCRVWRVS